DRAFHDPDHLRGTVTWRHEDGDRHAAGEGPPHRLQYEGLTEVAPLGACCCAFLVGGGGGYAPCPVLLRTEQGRERGRRVEAGQAQPVDRTVIADVGASLHVADQAV